jgi:putative ABC transport system substrate-binding protein
MTIKRSASPLQRRRHLLLALAASPSCYALPLLAQTADKNLRRVGVLAPSTRAKEEVTLKPFFDQMRVLRWIEGQTISYDRAYADDQPERLPRLATELVARKPDLIYAPPASSAVAAKQATQTIPIVFGTGTDPVGTGLVSSLARPGGNVTGIISVIDSLAPKLIELLGEMLPRARRIGYLGDPNDPRSEVDRSALVAVASARGLTIIVGEASQPMQLGGAVNGLIAQRVDAIITGTSSTFNMRVGLMEIANAQRVPVIGHRAQLADAGALFAYGASLADQLRRSAYLVDKILKGAKPADLPIEQPTKFELVINLKAAKTLGITIPRALLLRADEVIQ